MLELALATEITNSPPINSFIFRGMKEFEKTDGIRETYSWIKANMMISVRIIGNSETEGGGGFMLIYLQAIESEEEKNKFEQLYLRYRGLMYYVALKILNNPHSAEDAVHQAFLSIIENLKKVSDVKCPQTRSYVVIIVERKAIDIVRANSKIVDIAFDETIAGITIPPVADNDLADAMAKLPARYREILLLRYDNGFNTKEIAKMLNMERGSVQKMLWRAKEALQKRMKKKVDSY